MLKVLRQQLELVPEDVRARILLATRLAFSQQDADESIRHLQTAVALRPNDPSTLYNAACTYGCLLYTSGLTISTSAAGTICARGNWNTPWRCIRRR